MEYNICINYMTRLDNKIDYILSSLGKSKFRSGFHLKDKDISYIKAKGMDIILKHANDFIKKRLALEVILNDGKQTPMRGHPVFVAQHATATCCRECLMKWHYIPKDKELTKEEQEYVVLVIMTWIKKEVNNYVQR